MKNKIGVVVGFCFIVCNVVEYFFVERFCVSFKKLCIIEINIFRKKIKKKNFCMCIVFIV